MTAAVPRRATLRVVVWAFHLVLPLLGLWLLLAQPHFDVVLEHHGIHFGLVVAVAAVNVALGVRMSEVARRRADARLFLVSLVFLSSAGFLLLHALATPQVLLTGRNAGFAIATPVGLLLAAVFAVISSLDLTPERADAVLRRQALLRGGLFALLVGWAVVSLLGLPPLDSPLPEEASRGPLTAMAVAGVALYALASARYFRLHRRRPSVILIAVLTAFALLAEAMIAVALARNWHASWWEWHLLMAFAFAFVYYSAHVQYAREGSWSSLFHGIYLQETISQIRREHAAALESLVEAMQQPQGNGARPVGRVVADLADRFDLTEGQAQVLEQAAEALVAEREQIQRLRALVAVGAEARVIVDERQLLERGVELTGEALRPDALRVGLVEGERLVFPVSMRARDWPERDGDGDGEQPADDGGDPCGASLKTLEPVEAAEGAGGRLVLPLTVKDRPAGVLDVRRAVGPFADRDRWLLRALASQLSIGLENARLYRQLDGLFRQYMSPDVATALLADPTQAALGGEVAEVTVLFADLRGFTPFSERTTPDRVVAMLNQYFGRAVPVLLANGGTVVQFVGDAVMALFNAPARQPDHALRAARAALGMQAAIEAVAERETDWPRFRVGVNTGPALIGNIGSDELRNFTAIGDTVNLAARLEQEVAEAGQVVIGPTTQEAIRHLAIARPLDPIEVKGKRDPVACWVLEGLKDDPTTWSPTRPRPSAEPGSPPAEAGSPPAEPAVPSEADPPP
ncbi:MAG: Adenylate cyclase family 3 (some protein containing domain)-like protein [Actinomycetia bacterium]|nr:Adenylate cyclase family 3 (some protein containing domain)-like protein [Actinomycetes bacterium]